MKPAIVMNAEATWSYFLGPKYGLHSSGKSFSRSPLPPLFLTPSLLTTTFLSALPFPYSPSDVVFDIQELCSTMGIPSPDHENFEESDEFWQEKGKLKGMITRRFYSCLYGYSILKFFGVICYGLSDYN
jgi:hypothetical protein